MSRWRWPWTAPPEPHRGRLQLSGSWGPSARWGVLSRKTAGGKQLSCSVPWSWPLSPLGPRHSPCALGGEVWGGYTSPCPPFVQVTKANCAHRRVGRGVEVWAGQVWVFLVSLTPWAGSVLLPWCRGSQRSRWE